MPVYYTPGVYFEKIDSGRRKMPGLRTDIPGFVGIAQKGPIDMPIRLESWKQFQSVFGAFIPQSYLGYAVHGFFENGGDISYVVRVADIDSAKKAEAILLDKNGNPTIQISALNQGQWGNRIKVFYKVFSSMEFTLTFSLGDRIKEIFENLSLNRNHSRYLEKIINQEEKSNLVTVNDMESASAMPNNLPDPQKIENGFLYLKDGVDGISSIKKDDVVGDETSEKKRGLRCYEGVDEVSMICIPDIMIQPVKVEPPYEEPPEAEAPDPCLLPKEKEPEEEVSPTYEPSQKAESPPEFTQEDIRTVQQEMIEHCEIMKDRIAILDSLFGADLSEVQDWRKRFDSKYAVLYYPWIRVDDPLRLDNQITRLIPPSGHIAGIYARSDHASGVHKAPANEEVLGARDVAVSIEKSEQNILNPMGINCLRTFPGRGVMVWGARTISSDSSWKFVNVRRLLIMIEESVEASMQWAVFEPNDFNLRMGIRVSVSSFLEELWRRGALVGSVPEGEAFFVKCDEDNNPQEVIDAGKVITEIGVAPSIPGEFIIFRIGKVEDMVEVVEES